MRHNLDGGGERREDAAGRKVCVSEASPDPRGGYVDEGDMNCHGQVRRIVLFERRRVHLPTAQTEEPVPKDRMRGHSEPGCHSPVAAEARLTEILAIPPSWLT